MAKEIETERKYIILMPNVLDMICQDEYTRSEIEQIYLPSAAGITRRIRKRIYDCKTVYTETKKTRISIMSVIEDERNIDEAQYEALKAQRDSTRQIIRKTRHAFRFGELVFEIDIYPQWGSCAILECELTSEAASISLPPFLSVIKEVTGDKRYSNAGMAKHFPEEIVG